MGKSLELYHAFPQKLWYHHPSYPACQGKRFFRNDNTSRIIEKNDHVSCRL